MNRTLKTLLATTAAGCMMAASVHAQNPTVQERAQLQNRINAGSPDTGKLDPKTHGATFRVSQLIGQNIQNSQGESVGEINDLVMDANTGRLRYAAVTYGGFLGVGNKMFAVPFAAFQVKVDADAVRDRDVDAGDYVLVLNVTQQQLEGQQGFDEENWPNMADPNWSTDLDKRYGVNRAEDAKDRVLRENRNNNP
jgi:sporulation protein YlmC with PRC-barrel domain